MMRALLLLCAIPLQADELDFSKHHPSGAAIVEYHGERFIAAYQLDSFDPVHTPELGFQILTRLVLVPDNEEIFKRVGDQDFITELNGRPYQDGHIRMSFGEWRANLIPNDVAVRELNRRESHNSFEPQRMRVLVTQRRDAILITFMDADHADRRF